MAPRRQKVEEPKERKDKEKDKDFKDHSKEVKDSDAKNFKDKEKEIDHKPVKEFKEIKEADKWIGENFPVDPGTPVEGGTTLEQLARRVASLEAVLAKGQRSVETKRRPAAGKKAAKKRGA